jgi:hypothetical protein
VPVVLSQMPASRLHALFSWLSSSSLSQVLALEGSVRSLAPSLGAVPAGSPPQTGA